MFATLKARLETIWHKLDGDAEADIKTALGDVEAKVTQFGPLLQTAKTDLEAIVAEVEPGIKAAVSSRLGELLTAAEAILKDVPGL